VAAQVEVMTGGRLMDLLQIEGDEDAGVPAAFGRSYAALFPAAAAMFQTLSTAHPTPLSAGAAARLAGTSLTAAERALHHLVNVNLVRGHSGGLFGVSELLRRYAASRLSPVDLSSATP
jgi:hypothetical protein